MDEAWKLEQNLIFIHNLEMSGFDDWEIEQMLGDREVEE